MHQGHDHDHLNGGGDGGASRLGAAGIGHNRTGARPAQWQRPHDLATPAEVEPHPRETDLDLVEAAFVEGFSGASDPTSFLRLARIPFEAISQEGAKLSLLRVEVDAATDVGSLTPHLGGTSFRYDPLPASMISHRKRLRFIYCDGQRLHSLDLAQVKALEAA
jgi:hypothetical protein